MKPFALLLLLLFLGAASAGGEQCADLINTRCQVCHYKSRICQVLGKKSTGQWTRTVENMIRYGAKLSDTEKNNLIDCLKSAPVGADFVCKN